MVEVMSRTEMSKVKHLQSTELSACAISYIFDWLCYARGTSQSWYKFTFENWAFLKFNAKINYTLFTFSGSSSSLNCSSPNTRTLTQTCRSLGPKLVFVL